MASSPSSDEFPLLPDLGLYAADIRGDGNCLFNALSDQIFGDQSHHHEIRARVIDFMCQHADYYKGFLGVQPGGGTRRNPKRKNAGAYSSPASYQAPTPEEIDRAFEQHVQRMARGGTWGDNMEIVAFAAAYNTDVRIYLPEFTYMIQGQGDEGTRKIAHIAYHEWEHYSSIRNLDGPHTGEPHVKWKKLSEEEQTRLNVRSQQKSLVEPWKIKIVMQSLNFLTDTQTIKHALEKYGGNVDEAVSFLMDAEETGSISSTQESSSVERDYDSDDDQIWGPNKRANRNRMSRTGTSLIKGSQSRRAEMASRLAKNDGSQESVSQAVQGLELPDSKEPSPVPSTNDSTNDDDEWLPSGSEINTEAGSSRGPTRLKINMSSSDVPKTGRTMVRHAGPKTRPAVRARDLKEAKKRQQKDARKVRAQQSAKVKPGSALRKQALPILTKNEQKSPPPVLVQGHLKTLYI